MPYSVEGKLVVAISSRALFDFEEENRVFEKDGEPAYIALQYARLDVPAREGVAFPLVKKLLAFGPNRVEVVVLSKNDPVSGLRVFRSAKQAGLNIERGVFTRGRRSTARRWAPAPPSRFSRATGCPRISSKATSA